VDRPNAGRRESPATDSAPTSLPGSDHAAARSSAPGSLAGGGQAMAPDLLAGAKVFAFCGIGNPPAFFDDLSRWHVPIAEKKSFSDHHKYSSRELEQLQLRSEACGAVGLVTTEKDAENLLSTDLRLPILIAGIDLVFTAESELLAAIDRKLAARQGAAA